MLAAALLLSLPWLPQAHPATVTRRGIPFRDGEMAPRTFSSGVVAVHARARRIWLLGMTDSAETRPAEWPDPNDPSRHFWIGEQAGTIRVKYADGVEEAYPLVIGEGLWWGKVFWVNPEPYPHDPALRAALADSLRVYPPQPVEDGRYVASIAPREAKEIDSIVVEGAPPKLGGPVIDAITVTPPGEALPVEAQAIKPLSSGRPSDASDRRLEALRQALYSTAENFRGPASPPPPPANYHGPVVAFDGGTTGTILTAAFAANLQDMAAKVTPDGMYHTSTAGAPNWSRYVGFGTYKLGLGRYYDESWGRDLGRSLGELCELGYLAAAGRCADWVLKEARLAANGSAALRYRGADLPPHWWRIVNQPSLHQGPLENDGHGLIMLFLYRYWQRTEDRDAWARARWDDLRAAGDWIGWQFAHPGVTGASDVLHTTSECAAMDGESIYADIACRDGLLGFAEIADGLGERDAARSWRALAARMTAGISRHYPVADAAFGPAWTEVAAGWPHRSSVLGPLLFASDLAGFAPDAEPAAWRERDRNSYLRLVARYRTFGFYGDAMGYGQGFVTQAALLLDRMDDASRMLDWTAREIYDPRVGTFIVPEGVHLDPTGKYWFRIGDLGNGVQEAEIVKALRLILGWDDTRPANLRWRPRLPFAWKGMAVRNLPVAAGHLPGHPVAHITATLRRDGDTLAYAVSADRDLGEIPARMGPFRSKPANSSAYRSGDAWWIDRTIRVGPAVNTGSCPSSPSTP